MNMKVYLKWMRKVYFATKRCEGTYIEDTYLIIHMRFINTLQ